VTAGIGHFPFTVWGEECTNHKYDTPKTIFGREMLKKKKHRAVLLRPPSFPHKNPQKTGSFPPGKLPGTIHLDQTGSRANP
jgi:hypothetical protein